MPTNAARMPTVRERKWTRGIFLTMAIAWMLASSLGSAADGSDPAGVEFFERKIRPVLVERCYKCHSASGDVRGGLRVDSPASMRDGGDSGPAVVPGDPEGSLLLQALRYESLQMPPDGKLSAAVIADFAAWIRAGGADPRPVDPTPPAKPASFDAAAARAFWSFQPPRQHPPPTVGDATGCWQPIDRFLQAKIESERLRTAPLADPRTWIRRASFDLTGLPPTPMAIDAFTQDSHPDARARVVDRLLASPAFGEHWAVQWLDLARYGEDQAHIVGNNKSLFYPNAYLYRDWVIRALNVDLPYDKFVTQQLAADLHNPADAAALPALGFLGLGPKYYNRNRIEVMADEWEDRVDTVGRTFLGLTIACARCHDHKFDPIPTTDYYALAGVFASTEMFNRPILAKPTEKNGQAKNPEDSLHIVRDGPAVDLAVFTRGDPNNQGEKAPRRFLSVLSAAPLRHGSGRLELARQIANADNPLTARVLVNRVWARLFGRGLVATSSNFGQLGDRPTHPELLDDLAVRFIANGWSIKRLTRELVLSAAYARGSIGDVDTMRRDPDNRFLSRMPRRRLTIEQWRDAALWASGELETPLGGPSIDPLQPTHRRRTVYSRISRLELNRMLVLFDRPDANVHADRRAITTTPLQSMFLMNSPFIDARAGRLGSMLWHAASNDAARLPSAYRRLFGRPPTALENQLALAFLGASDADGPELWRRFAQVLLASNEMMFLD